MQSLLFTQLFKHPTVRKILAFNAAFLLLGLFAVVYLCCPVTSIPYLGSAYNLYAIAAIVLLLAAMVCGSCTLAPYSIIDSRSEQEWMRSIVDRYPEERLIVTRGQASRFVTSDVEGQEVAVGKCSESLTRCCINIGGNSYDLTQSFETNADNERERVFRVFGAQDDGTAESEPLLEFRCKQNLWEGHAVKLRGLFDFEISPESGDFVPERFDILVRGEVLGSMQRRLWQDRTVAIVMPGIPDSLCAMIASCCLLATYPSE